MSRGTVSGNGIVTDGLILALDAANPKSYPGSGNIWYDMSKSRAHSTLINSPTWNSQGYFSFDGINDGADGIDVPQNYVDLMIGLQLVNPIFLGMIFAKYNDEDYSLRGYGNSLLYNGLNQNDWGNGGMFYNGNFVTTNVDMTGKFNIYRSYRTNSAGFNPPFVYSISSDFQNRRLRGYLAFVLCYDRVLTNQEVLQNYNATKTRFGL